MSYQYYQREPRFGFGEPNPAGAGSAQAPAPATAKLTGPTSIQRGTRGTYSVTNAPQGATFSNWRFTSGRVTVSRTGNNNLADWSGTMVQSGTISVTMSAGGSQVVLSLGVTVTARSWSENAAAVPLGRAGNGTLPVQPRLGRPGRQAGDPGLGVSPLLENHNVRTRIANGGPNAGYNYLDDPPVTWTTRAFTSNALYDSSHPFFRAHDPARRGRPLPGGRIDIATIRQNVEAHEGVISPPATAPAGYASHQQALINHLRTNPINILAERDVSHTSVESNRDYANRINGYVNRRIAAAKAAAATHPRDITSGAMTFKYPYIHVRSLRLLVNGGSARLTVDNPAGRTRWSSSDSKIATIDGNGTVRPVAQGRAIIRVTNADGDVDEIPVTVAR